MKNPLYFISFPILLQLAHILSTTKRALALSPACGTKCGSLEIKYPLGTGDGCGSPRFHPYISCSGDQLLLTTHDGTYPVTSISYDDNTIIINPPSMSTCTSMHPFPTTLGLDWAGPFQLGSSSFILLSCEPPTSSLTLNGHPICDPSSPYLCGSIYTCPAVVSLGLPLFPPTNTCCVYSPANLDARGELAIHGLGCRAYASVVSLGAVPTDPAQWHYGVALKYTLTSGGVCGYAPPSNSFVCVCNSGYNTTTDCNNNNLQDDIYLSSSCQLTWKVGLGLMAGLLWTAA
ncbi:hypothetical protein NMG60_11007371 [Bertholletia excelsa]